MAPGFQDFAGWEGVRSTGSSTTRAGAVTVPAGVVFHRFAVFLAVVGVVPDSRGH